MWNSATKIQQGASFKMISKAKVQPSNLNATPQVLVQFFPSIGVWNQTDVQESFSTARKI